MSLNMPITKRRIRNHFQYSFWKYLVLVAIVVFGWNLFYTTTRYRSPENLKVEFYAEGSTAFSDAAQTLADQVHAAVMPNMEEVTSTVVSFDSTYGDMQLLVWISAAQGDVYLLSKDRFQSIASNEATLDLEPYLADQTLHAEGLDLENGYVSNTETGKRSLMGIPADRLTGLSAYGLETEGMVLCVLANNGNDEYSLRFLDYLLTNLRGNDAGAADNTVTPETGETPETTAAPETTIAPVA